MILSADAIRQAIVDSHLLVKPEYISLAAWESRCKFIEGCSFDLTLGRVFEPQEEEDVYLTTTERKLPNQREIQPYAKVRNEYGWNLTPGYYTAQTGEEVNLPFDIMGFLFPRASTFRPGVIPHVTTIKPGYSGALTFGLTVHTKFPISIGARLITLTFMLVNADSPKEVDAYGGIWSGKKVTTYGTERAF